MKHKYAKVGAVALAGLSLALGARPVAAQKYTWSITPWAGAYVPTHNSFRAAGTDIERSNSFITGARITGWGNGALGLELEAGYSPASVSVAGTTVNGDRDTQVFLGSLKLMLGVSPATSSGGFYIEGGPALIRRGRDVTSEGSSSTDWGGVLGLGFRIPFSRAVALRLEGEDYMYSGSFSEGADSFQNDLVLNAGLSIAL